MLDAWCLMLGHLSDPSAKGGGLRPCPQRVPRRGPAHSRPLRRTFCAWNWQVFEHQAPSIEHQASSGKHQASSSKHQASSIKHQALSIKQRTSSTKHQAPSLKHQASRITHRAPNIEKLDTGHWSDMCFFLAFQLLSFK